MKRDLLRNLLFLSLLAFLPKCIYANHIVGGELLMRPVGNAGSFEITLIQFWDQNNLIIPRPGSGGNRDETADLFIYRKRDNERVSRVTLNYISSETIQYQNKACANIRSLNTTMGTYQGNITMSAADYSDPEGYYMVWERCCRNSDINNITSPGDAGMVFYLEFPPITIPNSSPRLAAPNGQYICSNRSFSMNMSATDADGDELRYSLVTPIRGNTTPGRPNGVDNSSNGYPLVTWERGISLANVIPGPKPLAINNAGILTVTAGSLGLYVFSIQVEEFRNGKKIGAVRRDFQLLVIDCNDDQPEQPVILMNEVPVQQVLFCPERPVTLETESSADWSYQWQRNGLNLPGAVNPTITVSDTGVYSVVKSYTKKCSRDTSSLTVKVGYADPIVATISVDKEIICDGEVARLLANDGKVASNLALSWSRDNVLLPDNQAALEVKDPGAYILKLSDEDTGCAGADTLQISRESVSAKLPARTGVIEGSKVTLSPVITPAEPTYTYTWSPTDGIRSASNEQNVTVGPLVDTKYTVTVATVNGCVAEASTEVYVIDKMHIPTSFTPNNDGKNDKFEIFNAKDQIVEMRIYNRWGEVIFASDGYDVPWNGTYKDNTPVPAGSYPYVIKTNEQEVNGVVLLLK
ncbi:gliding motility-associated C-terminal domain-containing protein [Dyadobacter sp. CY326]|uniref:gliding motility-associated C-terminal domain-containing protein n=1 Tax=Dyadobacter sp. CY326 TaxID=2907300 RepID=UPI001F35598D|nr:gliding motility-associated C-terminal domain-containing protein [Dyadobacter sp. CY326]MCE7064765.1 gliding motility-associated C-terminal domain-containing protein [Dyadobacter sp. CY326]